ncbi:Alpha/Beta hydrolase protein [Phlebopus sp. FC_14]|nr:Alpha/Beta hydrolase protein [Phlebopus sp. FC_14]
MEELQSRYRNSVTTRGFEYHYLSIPAQPGKPTLLFLHGFPSTSYDWYRQIEFFEPKGYGLVVPDMLGYGGTAKPVEPAAFLHTAIAQDIVDILDAEGSKDVFAIGHDWGSGITTILAIKHADRFAGFGWVAVPYSPPRDFPPLEIIFKAHAEGYGRPLLGYWTLFRQDEAAAKVETNLDSMLDVLYPADPEIWKTYMNLPGELEKFVQQGKRLEKAPYLTDAHYHHIRKSLADGGLTSPLNWYKCMVQGINNSIKDNITDEELHFKKPAFFAAAKFDYVCPIQYAILQMKQYAAVDAELLTLEEFDTGHYVQLERYQEFNSALERWITNEFSK